MTLPSPTDGDLQPGQARAMRLRVYPSRGQTARAGHWLWVAQKFRNEAVAFVADRRRQRAAWLRQHPVLARDGIDPSLAGSDATACSRWLTHRLEASRATVVRELGLQSSKAGTVEAVSQAFRHLSREERDAVKDGWLLTVPRTVLDQVLRDLDKTLAKAVADRRHARATGSRKKQAGFPRHRKHAFPSSVRLQAEATKNRAFREHWDAGTLFVPGLGRIKFRDAGYSLPSTPPKLLTLSRNAAGQWHVAFLCVAGEHQGAWGRRQERERAAGLAAATLPMDPATGLPAIEGLDASLPHRMVSNRHRPSGKTAHLKRMANRLKKLNRSVARKRKGSRRWQKAKQAQGRLHVRVADGRKAEICQQAQAIAARSAIVCAEDHLLAFVMQNRFLAASATEAALGLFKTELARACAKHGHLFLLAPRFAPTTQACPTPGCGFINKALAKNLSIRAWDCPRCGQHHDRDLAAADNIQGMALRQAIDRLEQGWSLEPSTGAESAPGMLSSHRLRPDLAAFIARGGLAALLEARLPVKAAPGATRVADTKPGKRVSVLDTPHRPGGNGPVGVRAEL